MIVRRGYSWRVVFRLASSSVVLLATWVIFCSLASSDASGWYWMMRTTTTSLLPIRGGGAGAGAHEQTQTQQHSENDTMLAAVNETKIEKKNQSVVNPAQPDEHHEARPEAEESSISVPRKLNDTSHNHTAAVSVDTEWTEGNGLHNKLLRQQLQEEEQQQQQEDLTFDGDDNINNDDTSNNDDDDDDNKLLSIMDRKRLLFLDRIAWLSSSWMKTEQDAHVELHHDDHGGVSLDLDALTPESDLALPGRYFHIVTTATLPWFTGTAVNPLLRAAYLHRRTVQINSSKTQATNATNSNDNNNATTATTTAITPPRYVTLVIPWLELATDQQELYGRVFADRQEQEDYIRMWLRQEAGMPDAACPETGLQILFYNARYHSGLRSIFAMGDMLRVVDDQTKDVCILEEPEHVNWFRAPGDGWTKKYQFVVGVVHTNYKEYASSHYSGLWTAPAISMMSAAMVRAYCHKVIKLSAVLQTYAPEKEVVSNVHGVRTDFLNEGRRRAELVTTAKSAAAPSAPTTPSTQIYFVGKLLWAKGLDLMLELEDYYKQCTGRYFPIDIYGSGPEQGAIMRGFHGRRKGDRETSTARFTKNVTVVTNGAKTSVSQTKKKKKRGNPLRRVLRTTLSIFGGTRDPFVDIGKLPSDIFPSLEILQENAKERLAKIKQTIDSVELPQTFAELRRQPIPARFPGRVDHAEIKEHKIFVNPSTSEVLCTTTAEALAMGKWAIVPYHPSNAFFLKFPNCLAYRSKFEFVANLRWAMTHDPEPMTPELLRHFTWEAATDRLIDASSITVREALERERLGRSKLDERIAWLHNELGKGVSGDILRKICGAGPVSHQVKYLKENEGTEEEGDEDDGAEDEDDGLSRKFRRSSFAEAIRATVGDLSSFIQ